MSTSTISLDRISKEICKISYSNPPFNLLIPEAIYSLRTVVKELSEDDQVKVVIFTSTVNDYFVNHFDDTDSESQVFLKESFKSENPAWTDLVISLTNAPFVSIALIRGRTRGGGNELALACDLRYASNEKSFFSQPEVGLGILPGGGGSERLSRLTGRDRALEAILGSQDYDSLTAEKYGWITRSLPDDHLDDFVEEISNRIASFDKQALSGAKKQVNRATLPPDEDIISAFKEFVTSLQNPGFGNRAKKLAILIAENGAVEVEKELGHYIKLANKQ